MRLDEADGALLEHLRAYEQWNLATLEMHAALKDAAYHSLRANGALKRNANSTLDVLASTSYPSRMLPLATITTVDDDRELNLVRTEPGLSAELVGASDDDASDASDASDAVAVHAADEETEEMHDAFLRGLGVGDALRSEIVSAITPGNEAAGLVVGDRLVLEDAAASSGESHALRSNIEAAASSLSGLKEAHFRGLIGAEAREERPEERKQRLAERRRKAAADPLHWFAAMPPPALRQAQRKWERVLELAVDIANLQRRMHETRYRYVTHVSEGAVDDGIETAVGDLTVVA